MNRVDQILAAQGNLPSFLRRDRETIEADEHVQELRRASFGRGRLTEEERTVSRGVMLEEIARANLDLKGVDAHTENVRLSEGLELQGRYADAAKVHPVAEESERLLATDKAIEADDDQFCECPSVSTELNGKPVEVHPHYEVKRIFSRRHRKMVSLVGCQCGELNATPNPPEQLQRILNAHRSSSRAGKPTEHEHVVLK